MLTGKGKYFIEVIIHILFWTGVYYVLRSLTAASINLLTYNDGKIAGGVSANMVFPYPALVLGVLMVMFYGNIFWLFKKLIQNKNKVLGVAAIAGWFIMLFATNYFLINRQTDTTLPGSSSQMSFSLKTKGGSSVNGTIYPNSKQPPNIPPPPPEMKFTTNDWQGMQLVMALIFLAVFGAAAANFFIKEWIYNNLARSKAEAQQYSTEVKFLRSQVNPHFLFNTLNNLFSMALKRGDDEVADGISKLSGMMRYMLYESNTESVALQKEIECLQDCIALNKLRYAGNEVSVIFKYPQPAVITGIQMAPMLFIPFLENAFKHGVLIGQHSNIIMTIAINERKLIFTCENINYNTVKKLAEEQSGIGLENVQRRLQLVYPGKYTLQAGPVGEKYNVNLEINLA